MKIKRPDPYIFLDGNKQFDDDAFHKWFTKEVEPANSLLPDTAEDVLRDLVNDAKSCQHTYSVIGDLLERAEKVLNENK